MLKRKLRTDLTIAALQTQKPRPDRQASYQFKRGMLPTSHAVAALRSTTAGKILVFPKISEDISISCFRRRRDTHQLECASSADGIDSDAGVYSFFLSKKTIHHSHSQYIFNLRFRLQISFL